jgi:hypothetical protein
MILTDHETAARDQMAARLNKPAARWTVVDRPEPGVWYDFSDPATGLVGQCRMSLDGTWMQDPRGQQPVVFAYHTRVQGIRRRNRE